MIGTLLGWSTIASLLTGIYILAKRNYGPTNLILTPDNAEMYMIPVRIGQDTRIFKLEIDDDAVGVSADDYLCYNDQGNLVTNIVVKELLFGFVRGGDYYSGDYIDLTEELSEKPSVEEFSKLKSPGVHRVERDETKKASDPEI